MKFRTRFDRGPRKPGLVCDPKKARTKQEFREECDVNVIHRKFMKSGFIPQGHRQAHYGDYSNLPSFHESFERVEEAAAQFMRIPAAIRAKFRNDPGLFLQFASDPSNHDELVEMGLMDAPKNPLAPDRAAGAGSRGAPPEKGPKAPKTSPAKPEEGDGD